MNTQEIIEQFEALLGDVVDETKVDLKETKADVAQYMHARSLHLAGVVNDPGFSRALRAERNNVVMYAGLQIGDDVDSLQERVVGAIGAAMRIAASVLLAI